MRPVPAISVVASAVLCGALFGACLAPSPATDAAHQGSPADPAALPPTALTATGRLALADGPGRSATPLNAARRGCDGDPGCSRAAAPGPLGSDDAPRTRAQALAEPRGAAATLERARDSCRGLPGGETYVVYGGEPTSPPPTSPALLWLALAVPAGVAYRLVIAMIEGRQAHIVLLACAALFLSGLVLIGA